MNIIIFAIFVSGLEAENCDSIQFEHFWTDSNGTKYSAVLPENSKYKNNLESYEYCKCLGQTLATVKGFEQQKQITDELTKYAQEKLQGVPAVFWLSLRREYAASNFNWRYWRSETPNEDNDSSLKTILNKFIDPITGF